MAAPHSKPILTGHLRWLKRATASGSFDWVLQQEWVDRGGAGNYFWVDIQTVDPTRDGGKP